MSEKHTKRLEIAAAICVQMSDLFEELAALIESELDEIAPLRKEEEGECIQNDSSLFTNEVET